MPTCYKNVMNYDYEEANLIGAFISPRPVFHIAVIDFQHLKVATKIKDFQFEASKPLQEKCIARTALDLCKAIYFARVIKEHQKCLARKNLGMLRMLYRYLY